MRSWLIEEAESKEQASVVTVARGVEGYCVVSKSVSGLLEIGWIGIDWDASEQLGEWRYCKVTSLEDLPPSLQRKLKAHGLKQLVHSARKSPLNTASSTRAPEEKTNE